MTKAAAALLALVGVTMHAQSRVSTPIIVTPDNFNRAETESIYAGGVKSHGLGSFEHHREPIAIDFQIVRPDRQGVRLRRQS